MKKLLLMSILALSGQSLLAQCNWNLICNHPPAPTGQAVGIIGNYTNQSLYGANCHAFAKHYFDNGLSIGNAQTQSGVHSLLQNMAAETIIDAGPFSGLTVPVNTEAEADGVFYLVNNTITHSAIKIGKEFGSFGTQLYLSKWEPCGPVVQHTLTDIGYLNNDPCGRTTEYKFFKYIGSGGGTCVSDGLTMTATTLSNNQVRVTAASGWNNHVWSVSANGNKVYDGGSFAIFERTSNSPSAITVTLTAGENTCTGTDTETIIINPPLLSGCSGVNPPVISSNNICTSCSCAAYDGSFLVSAPSGWSNHQWSISGAGNIVWDLGSYIYIERNPNHSGWPNNDIVVTLTATKNGCTKTHVTNPINLPTNCSSGGGFGFSVANELELEISVDEREVGALKPNTKMEFSVYDLNGNSLGSTVTSDKTFTVNLKERFGQGPYILRLQKEGKLYTRKVYFLKEEEE